MDKDGWVIDLSFGDGTVFIDKTRTIDGTTYFQFEDGTLGSVIPRGVRRIYDTREEAVQSARLKITDRMRRMLEKCQ